MKSRTPADPARVEAAVRSALEHALRVAAGRDFTTFRCGTALPCDLAAAHRIEQEAFRDAVRTGLQARLAAAWPERRVDTQAADLVIEATPDEGGARIRIAPLFVAGRYAKLARGLSQTVLHCRPCRGRAAGCAVCAGTGRVWAEAVEDFVRPPLERAVGGTGSAFHGSGREDVDVRMLGAGRPFVVSVEWPLRRAPDLTEVAARVLDVSGGRVSVADLAVVTRAEMGRITSDHGDKTYRVVVGAAGAADLPADSAERLRALTGAELAQRTPRRVDDRRADLVRRRRVLAFDVEECGARRLVAVVRTDPGTYVKELVSGDEGRTTPSVASLLGVACVCEELDVLAVE